jgi:hypothetical protein
MRRASSPLRVLDFDVEARPLGWIAEDLTHKEVTVIAWAWMGETPQVRALSRDDRSRLRMLRDFRAEYDRADMVVGHFIRGYDLATVSAMFVEFGQPPLGQKLTHDTKLDLVRLQGISKSQKNLAALFGIEDEKLDMSVQDWRRANRLEPDGIERAVDRARLDVIQNMALYRGLTERGLLGSPKVWRP